MSSDLLLNLILIILGIFVLVRSGVYIVKSLIAIAHFFNISEFVLSFILMAFATTLPEFGVGLSSALSGKPLISLGNIIGANILTLGLTLGLVALISGRLTIHPQPNNSISSHHWLSFFLGIAPIVFLTDLHLSRFEGLILISLFFLYLASLLHLRGKIENIFHRGKSFWSHYWQKPAEPTFAKASTGKPTPRSLEATGVPAKGLRTGEISDFLRHSKEFLKNFLMFWLAVGFLLFAAFVIVKSAEALAVKIGISQLLVGVFIIAFATTLPELSFGLRAALSKREELSLGNLFGASVFNSTWILGLVSLISPITVKNSLSFWFSAATMVLILFLASLFLRTRNTISRLEGTILILICLIFIVGQIILIPLTN